MKKLYLFLFSLLFFSFLIFILGNYFFGDQEKYLNEHIENTYIEPNIPVKKIEEIEKNIEEEKNNLTEEEKEKIKIILKSAYNIKFIYYPASFNATILDYTYSFKAFLNSIYVKNKIKDLKIELYKEKNDVRGRMKDRSIKMFGVQEMKVSEFNSVGIHEFAHFIDLYFFEKEIFTDISDYFYNISWDGTKILKPGLKQLDFVSGYAMTNKYEDFAESFTYFILHNGDFFKKSNDSENLKQKYMFFTKYLFMNKEFLKTDFSIGNKVKPYYRDITKIDFSLENFLEFMKK
ncbi:MAG: hypothetical protein QM490_05800 [Candidatus Gracilibacteria bacterium]